MSKFLDIVETYHPDNNQKMNALHDFKDFLKAKSVHLGKTADGRLYIDDPINDKVFVIELLDVGTAQHAPEEDGEMTAIDAAADIDLNARKARENLGRAVRGKLPIIVKKAEALTNQINRY